MMSTYNTSDSDCSTLVVDGPSCNVQCVDGLTGVDGNNVYLAAIDIHCPAGNIEAVQNINDGWECSQVRLELSL